MILFALLNDLLTGGTCAKVYETNKTRITNTDNLAILFLIFFL